MPRITELCVGYPLAGLQPIVCCTLVHTARITSFLFHAHIFIKPVPCFGPDFLVLSQNKSLTLLNFSLFAAKVIIYEENESLFHKYGVLLLCIFSSLYVSTQECNILRLLRCPPHPYNQGVCMEEQSSCTQIQDPKK